MKQTDIIINADDFGKSSGRNQAIDECFKTGTVRSAGLIVTGQFCDDAVALAKAGGYIQNLHLHVNLSANLLHECSNDTPLTERIKHDPFFCKDGRFKPYKGLPQNISSIRKWRIAYNEIVAQYDRFIEVTDGRGNREHIDFHLWYNLTWPVAIALSVFTRRHRIKSVRYIGVHHRFKSRRYKFFCVLSRDPSVRYIPATNIDYYLSKPELFCREGVVELYCHPNYKDGVLMDDSPSYLKHDRRSMQYHIERLNGLDDIRFVSWEDLDG